MNSTGQQRTIRYATHAAIKRLAHWLDFFVHKLWRFASTRMSPGLRRYLYLCLVILFAGGTGYVFYQDPNLLVRMDPWPVLLLAIVVPFRLTANAVRYTILARFVERPMELKRAFSIVIAGNAANFLPLPGGLLVRAAGLTHQGQGYSQGLAVNVAGSLVWIGVASGFASVGAFYLSLPLVGGILAGGGALALLMGVAQLGYWKPKPALIFSLIGANLIFCVLATLRFLFALMAIGAGVELARAVLLSVSGPLGVITALAPGALGVSEAIATVLGVASGLGAAETFGAAATIRIVSLLVLGCVSLVIGYQHRTKGTGA